MLFRSVLTVAGPLDFETATSHQVTVRATSTDGSFSEQTFTINVTNVNEAGVGPVTDSNAAANQVAENSANGTVVATLSTVDPDNTAIGTNDPVFTYALADNFGGRFQIVGSQIQVLDGSLLDFENGPTSFTLNVTTNDGHGGTFNENLAINIADVNEAPTTIRLGGDPTLPEPSPERMTKNRPSGARSYGRS